MKYLFSCDGNIYSLEANSEECAKSMFVRKFLPYIDDVSYESFRDALSELEIELDSLGSIKDVIEI